MTSHLRFCLAILIVASTVHGQENSVDTMASRNTRSSGEELAAFKKMSMEELMNIEVTSVSKRPEKLTEAAAAIYVITGEDIRRSGVTSIPEALRLAPGVEVARNGAHSWSISIRGFNSDITNKLLVLIDGRSVYSPLYAGVFWDAQDTLLEDVDRIEVIAGPGGTMWGANAVNGVINIVTRSAKDTEGGFFELGGGDEERGFGGVRYGGRVGEDMAARAYFKYFNRDGSRRPAGGDAVDDWRVAQGGFRLDWEPTPSDLITLQGDMYGGEEEGQFRGGFTLGTLPGTSAKDDGDIAGGNLLARWSRQLDNGSDFKVQTYYDRTERDFPGTYAEDRDTFDIDAQHHFTFGDRNDFVWGLGYRLTHDEIENTPFATFDPDHRTDETFNAFLQDKIDLWDERLFLTLGSKFEHNDYTGFEIQPNARMTWLATERQTLWAAVSRAVRIPSRLDADLRLTVPVSIPSLAFPVYVTVDGNDDFESEDLWAWEAGHRIQVRDNLSFDLASFYNEYDDLQTQEAKTPIFALPAYVILPNSFDNRMEGESYGGALVANWQATSDWRLQFQYAYFELQLHSKEGSLDNTRPNIEGNGPENQVAVHSFFNLLYGLSLYTGVRYVDNLPNQNIHRYIALDASLSWKLWANIEASITGQNLTDNSHPEFSSSGGNGIERNVYGKVAWRF